MPDSPKAARHRIIFQSSARIASTVRLYCSATAEDALWADAVLGNLPVPLIRQNDHLKWFQSNAAGPNNYLEPGVVKRYAKPCTVSMRALCSALMGRQTRICLDIIGSPSLFLSIIPQTARQYKGRLCCFQPHPIKEQCRTAQKPPDTALSFSPARG